MFDWIHKRKASVAKENMISDVTNEKMILMKEGKKVSQTAPGMGAKILHQAIQCHQEFLKHNECTKLHQIEPSCTKFHQAGSYTKNQDALTTNPVSPKFSQSTVQHSRAQCTEVNELSSVTNIFPKANLHL